MPGGTIFSATFRSANATTLTVPALNETQCPPGAMRFLLYGALSTVSYLNCALYNVLKQNTIQGVDAAIFTQYSQNGGAPAVTISRPATAQQGCWDVIVTGLKPYGAGVINETNGSSTTQVVTGVSTANNSNDAFCIWVHVFDGADAAFTGLNTPANGWELLAGTDRQGTGSGGVTVTWGWQNENTLKIIASTNLTPNPPLDGYVSLAASMPAGGSPPGAKLNVKAIDGVELAAASAADGVPIYD